jgi:drug/metabolite transporter (DMT)-like permease
VTDRGVSSGGRLAALTVAALCCFAANSLLCRMALRPGFIDPVSFMSVRLVSGAAVLWLLAQGSDRADGQRVAGGWLGAVWLFAYASAFSFAYLRLPAGTGALILFGVVQATMIGAGVARGERPGALEWSGLLISVSGLFALTLPGLSAPDPRGALLMVCAGVGWALYSLRGRATARPIASNAGHFLRAVPLTLAVSTLTLAHAHATFRGLMLAVASGAVASGIGYVIWYAALRGLSSSRAGMVQLAVPALAAGGGVVLLRETLSVRLVASGVAILGGVLLATVAHAPVTRSRTPTRS